MHIIEISRNGLMQLLLKPVSVLRTDRKFSTFQSSVGSLLGIVAWTESLTMMCWLVTSSYTVKIFWDLSFSEVKSCIVTQTVHQTRTSLQKHKQGLL